MAQERTFPVAGVGVPNGYEAPRTPQAQIRFSF